MTYGGDGFDLLIPEANYSLPAHIGIHPGVLPEDLVFINGLSGNLREEGYIRLYCQEFFKKINYGRYWQVVTDWSQRPHICNIEFYKLLSIRKLWS
jgi:hypothetical protein